MRHQADAKDYLSPDNVEKLYDVISKSTPDDLDYSVKMVRLSDANMERLSCSPLTSVEFNNIYKMFLTASEDTTMALFNVGFVVLLSDFVNSLERMNAHYW